MDGNATDNNAWQSIFIAMGIPPKVAATVLGVAGVAGTLWFGARAIFNIGRFFEKWEERFENQAKENAELKAENAELRVDNAKLKVENDFLRAQR